MTDDLLKRLAAPFSVTTVSWRIGAMTADKSRGMALAYIDARDVQDRLNEVCGIYWQARHHNCGGEKLACDIGIKVGDEWIWRGDGAGEVDLPENLRDERKDQMQDMAQKAAFSDSFKRAAVRWGVGRYLYDIDSPWVELEAKGRTHIIADKEIWKLRALLGGDREQSPQKPDISHGRHNTANGAPPFQRPPEPVAESQQLRLSSIRDELMARINNARSADQIEAVEAVWKDDLQLIETAHAPTGAMLRRLMAVRRNEFLPFP